MSGNITIFLHLTTFVQFFYSIEPILKKIDIVFCLNDDRLEMWNYVMHLPMNLASFHFINVAHWPTKQKPFLSNVFFCAESCYSY